MDGILWFRVWECTSARCCFCTLVTLSLRLTCVALMFVLAGLWMHHTSLTHQLPFIPPYRLLHTACPARPYLPSTCQQTHLTEIRAHLFSLHSLLPQPVPNRMSRSSSLDFTSPTLTEVLCESGSGHHQERFILLVDFLGRRFSLYVADMTENINTNSATHRQIRPESIWHALLSCAARLKELLSVKTAFVPWRQERMQSFRAEDQPCLMAFRTSSVSAGGGSGRHFPRRLLSNFSFY